MGNRTLGDHRDRRGDVLPTGQALRTARSLGRSSREFKMRSPRR